MRAVVFDLGNTLLSHGMPLNWQTLYNDALKAVLSSIGKPVSADVIAIGEGVLLKYNTRVNPREYEVSSDTIFAELFRQWGIVELNRIEIAKDTFYSFFQTHTSVYSEVATALVRLKRSDIKIGVLTDVAYGADRLHTL